MVRARDREAALRAGDAYATLLDEIDARLEDAAARRRQAEALLGHQYMLATNYLDLPRDTRPVLLTVIEQAARHYARLTRQLPARTKEALFFKEEEVRWSRDMAIAADEQGL